MILCEAEYMDEVNQSIADITRQIKQDKSLSVTYIESVAFNRQNAFEILNSMCKTMQNDGISLVIDATIGGFLQLESFAKDRNMPYIQISITKFPLVKSIVEYIKHKNGNDYAIIFENTKGELVVIFINN